MDCLFPRGLCRNCVCGILGNGLDREICTGYAGEEIVPGSLGVSGIMICNRNCYDC